MKKLIVLILCLSLFLTACSQKNISKITSKDDIAQMKIAVVIGTISVDFAEDNYPKAKILQFNSITDLVTAVKTKKVDCGLFDYVSLKPILDEDATLGSFPTLLTKDDYAFAVKKGNADLLGKLNEFIATIKEDGTYADLFKRWADDKNYIMPVSEPKGGNGVIKVGVSTTVPLPTVGIVDGKLVGTCPEMAYRFGVMYDYTIELVDMDFGALIPALQSGKIDFVASDMFITQERAKAVDFTNTYDGGGMCIFALKERFE